MKAKNIPLFTPAQLVGVILFSSVIVTLAFAIFFGDWAGMNNICPIK